MLAGFWVCGLQPPVLAVCCSSLYCLFLCVCVCLHVLVSSLCLGLCLCLRESERKRVCVCVHTHPCTLDWGHNPAVCPLSEWWSQSLLADPHSLKDYQRSQAAPGLKGGGGGAVEGGGGSVRVDMDSSYASKQAEPYSVLWNWTCSLTLRMTVLVVSVRRAVTIWKFFRWLIVKKITIDEVIVYFVVIFSIVLS